MSRAILATLHKGPLRRRRHEFKIGDDARVNEAGRRAAQLYGADAGAGRRMRLIAKPLRTDP